MKRTQLVFGLILVLATAFSMKALASSNAKQSPAKASASLTSQADADAMADALQAGDKKTIAALKKKGVSVDAVSSVDGLTGLMRVADEGSLDDVKRVVADGASVNKTNDDGETAIFYATYNGHVESALFLISKGAKTDIVLAKNSECVLHAAAKSELMTLAAKLKATAPACLKQKNFEGKTPSDFAAELKNTKLAKLLKP